MRTRSSSNLIGESSPNPTTLNPKRRNRRRSKQPFILEESPVDTMVDQRTMAELLRAPTEGYAEEIMVPSILAEHFKLKYSLINMMTSDQFFGLEKDNPHDHIRWFNKITSTNKYKDVPNSDVLTIIENNPRSANSRNKSIVSQVKSSDANSSSSSSQIAKLTHAVNQQTSNVTTAMTASLKQYQATPPPASVKDVEEFYVTFGGAYPYYQCLTADGNTFLEFRDNIQGYVSVAAVNYNQGNSGYRPPSVANQIRPPSFVQLNVQNNQNRPLPSNTIANPKVELKAITTRSGLVLDGPSVSIPLPFINSKEDERAEETLTDLELAEHTIKAPPPFIQNAKPPSQRNYVKMLKSLLSNKEKLLELASTPLNENCSAVIRKKLPKKLRDPGKFLISYGFSELKCKALTDLANRAICTPAGIARDVFVPVGNFTFLADFFIVDYESDPRVPLILGKPFLRIARALIDVHGEEMILRDGDERLTLNMRHDTSSYSNQPKKESINIINIYDDSYEDYLEDFFATNHLSSNPIFSSHTDLTSSEVINPLSGSTTSSSPDHLLEEFADELALITFSSRNDDIPFDIEFDLREIEYLLNHDPTKEMDSILEDSVDEYNLVDPDSDLVDTIPEMFTDEHTLVYLSPPLDDDVDDDLVELESDNDDVYDDPFDFKEDKIKEYKLLLMNLIPRDQVISFLPPSVTRFSIRIFPRILILLFMNFLSTNKFSGLKLYSLFHPKMRKKFSTPGFSLLKEFILLFSRDYLIGALKLSKSLKFLKARWRFFLALMERTSVF
uniref:Reverse transcriptase domain-containing protein n=1 Tax=Tanacetum cinerariifolium TaxID=118510 RepID=A0A6L2JPD1_TANCI|nr:hypothetical protein [Tanacetum cinerariifolium]